MLPGAYPGAAGRVARRWDLSRPLPVPREPMRCPMCGGDMPPKQWWFHLRNTGSPTPWRCDVQVKCMDCSLVMTFGLVVPEKYFLNAPTPYERGRIYWRQAQRILAGEA